MPVLVVSRDPLLLAAIERCAAAAGTALEVTDASGVSGRWERASLVLIGEDLLADLPVRERRPGVVVVGAGMGVEPGAATWRLALGIGAEHVVSLPEADGWLVDRLGAAEDGERRVGTAIAVVGACGGAGASTLALAMGAVATTRGLGALVVDADAWGGGLETMAGSEALHGARWHDVGEMQGRMAAATLRAAFPVTASGSVLSIATGAPRPGHMLTPTAISDLAEAARRAFDLVVIDLPRALLSDVPVDARVIVMSDRVRPVLAAAQLLAAMPPALIALRHAKGGTVDAADVAAVCGTSAVAYRSERVIAEAGEHGDPLPPNGALMTAASTLVDRVLR